MKLIQYFPLYKIRNNQQEVLEEIEVALKSNIKYFFLEVSYWLW